MTPERWLEVERLYQEALAREAVERSEFLRNVADGALRAEVESLLRYQSRAEGFMEMHARALEPPERGLFAGRVFGFYELKAPIGAGGMGEVYRAVDKRLERTVAVKILREHRAEDSELRERFKREAKIISSLSHPHICALYDVGTNDGVEYLVMEYLEGENLAQRLRSGPLPPAQVLQFLMQMIDALDKVHRLGIVHRDLKPANVMITKSGVKLLDFGVAGRLAPRGKALTDAVPASNSAALTTPGMIMGTPQYMAPEQLRGESSDARTDIYALGCLAYEMITGRKVFECATQAELISAILRDEPPSIGDLQPPSVARALERCLAKDPDDRWQTANDLLFHLRSASSADGNVGASKPDRNRRWLERAGWIGAIAVLGAFLWTQIAPDREPHSQSSGVPVRFSVAPAKGLFLSGSDVPFAVSPDGRQIAYVATSAAGTQQLWVHSLDSEEQRSMPGTEGASTPFWSPDSQWIGFFAENALKKVRASSGLTQVIATEVSTFGGAAWNREDVIIFPASRGGVARVSAKGGAVTRVVIDNTVQFSPHFLRDGKHFIFASGRPGTVSVGSLDGGPPRTLITFPVRISTLGYANGYVFYVQDSVLMASRVDEERLVVAGEPIRIAQGIPITTPARAPFSVSASGVLAYWPYPLGTPAVLRWLDREGRASDVVNAPAHYRGFTVSPDGRQLVFSRINRTGDADLWVRDLGGTTETQLSFEGAAIVPQWSPDGARIAYSGYGQRPPPKLYVMNLKGPRAASLVTDTVLPNFASGWSADSQSMLTVRATDPVTRQDLWIQRLQDGAAQRLAFNTPANESQGKISPDGRWIAYTTDQSGRDEVWVASFPTGETRQQVSDGGGRLPQWTAGGSELFYVSDDNRLVSHSFGGGGGSVSIGHPQALFRIGNLVNVDEDIFPTANAYVVAPDGKRFLVAVSASDPEAPPINVIVNWPALVAK